MSRGMVSEALNRNNAGQKMVAVWEYQKEFWYRSKAVDVAAAVPADQRRQRNGRKKRVGKATFPPANYFRSTQNPHFVALNDALEDLEKERERKREEARQKAEEDARREQIREEERGKLIEESVPKVAWDGTDISDYDGNCLMKIPKLDEFIRRATAHSSTCGKQLVLSKREAQTKGTLLRETWKCPCCEEELMFENCDFVKSTAVAQGASHSRRQPEFNLQILEGPSSSG